MKPTRADEVAALEELMGRKPVHHAPGAEAALAELNPEALPLLAETAGPLPSGIKKGIVVCSILRERRTLPDNVTGRCAACREDIEFRPDVPRRFKKLCPICAVRHARGDA